MKKLTKTTALILSALMLFGCADNNARSGAGDTTPPSESSVTESKNESSGESSDTENSSVTDNTSEESEENLVKNIEGYQTFSYDSSRYTITNKRLFFEQAFSPYSRSAIFEPTYEKMSKYMRKLQTSPVAIKCHVVGDSYYFINGKCGSVQVVPPKDVIAEHITYTPVMVDEIIDSYGFETDYKQGDIIYINEPILISQSYEGNDNEVLSWLDKQIEELEYGYEQCVEIGDSERIEIRKEELDKYKEFREYLVNNSDSVVIAGVSELLDRNESYFVFADNTVKTYGDNNKYVWAYGFYFDLENDEPNLNIDEKNEAYFQSSECYRFQWKYLKEKYGDHFKK